MTIKETIILARANARHANDPNILSKTLLSVIEAVKKKKDSGEIEDLDAFDGDLFAIAGGFKELLISENFHQKPSDTKKLIESTDIPNIDAAVATLLALSEDSEYPLHLIAGNHETNELIISDSMTISDWVSSDNKGSFLIVARQDNNKFFEPVFRTLNRKTGDVDLSFAKIDVTAPSSSFHP